MVLRWVESCVLLVWLASAAWSQQPGGTDRTTRQKNRERDFATRLSGATLVGHFTDSSRPRPTTLHEERYILESVRKLDSGQWLFQARIQYGEHNLTLPLTLPVEWADDTPVILVNNLPVPGLGTFSARVLIHNGYYAGYWRAVDHGGHLFGRVERIKLKQSPPAAGSR